MDAFVYAYIYIYDAFSKIGQSQMLLYYLLKQYLTYIIFSMCNVRMYNFTLPSFYNLCAVSDMYYIV